jgi:asparagine synthase (glutamine-hydrolysing)
MCGIAGVWRGRAGEAIPLAPVATAMSDAIRHRGPDDSGVWCDNKAGIAFGHRRLSVVDLSPAGHQPMSSGSSRFVMVFNGEIYNHAELRQHPDIRAAGYFWRGHSDTETLLCCFEVWGVRRTLCETVGMFALALWDARESTLYLARDRFGEKPLYYGWVNGNFAFGSELKAIRKIPGFPNRICKESLAQYLRFMYVPAPLSIYEGVYKVEPGCLLSIRGAPPRSAPPQALVADGAFDTIRCDRWWSVANMVEAGAKEQVPDDVASLNELEERLKASVRGQSVADVSLGAFLSGGIDSSTIVALMQLQSIRKVKTFTVAFEDSTFDESPYADAVARHLGTEHHQFMVTAADARAVIPQLPSMYDEPFADSSQIPTHLVCRAARKSVTVALSGDGGDELFGGYNRYLWGPRIWKHVEWLPYRIRRSLGDAVRTISPQNWDRLATIFQGITPGSTGVTRLGDKAHKFAVRLQDVRNMDDLYFSLVSEWPLARGPVRDYMPSGKIERADSLPAPGIADAQLRMMFRDSITYLPDDILCKVDRAAMATSLETRVPLLDHRVAEFAWRLPISMKIRNGVGKWGLRQILYRHVPRELVERPKSGFAIPIGEWLRGPLRSWAEELLDEERLRAEGYLDAELIRNTWAQHLSGRHDWTPKLWSILMFQSWLEATS